jgi:hypothetical protein
MTDMSRHVRLIGFASFALGLSAYAQVIEQPVSENRVEAVTVFGASPQRARDFAEAAAPKQRSLDLLARWDDQICVSVAGPPVHQAQYIADRISQRAFELGLEPGRPGCKTNLLIVVTAEPGKLIGNLVKDDPDTFGFNESGAVDTAGKAAFERFQIEERPVRAWVVTETFGADGMPIDGDARIGSGGNSSLPGNPSKDMSGARAGSYANVPMVRTDSTRLSSAVRSDISRVVVVADARALSGRSLTSVADYMAFFSLAQVDPDVDASGFESVLNLFASDDAADALKAGMTDWDRAYLSSLYSSKRNAASLSRQIQDISRRMVSE